MLMCLIAFHAWQGAGAACAIPGSNAAGGTAVINTIPAARDSNPTKSVHDYTFEIVREIPSTSVKDQYKTSTCWSFSVLSMLESELMRKGKPAPDLSEMFIVRKTYKEKAWKYIRLHGHMKFTGGGAINDPLDMIRKYGIVPESVYSGLTMEDEKHNHHEMDRVLKGYVEDVVNSDEELISPLWPEGYQGILNSYLGELPGTFTYEQRVYTPESFRDYLGINPDHYLMFSSFTHHPFYHKFIMEVPDNWSWGKAFNLPLQEMGLLVEHAIDKGYSIAWASDISDEGFGYRKGMAIVPEKPWDRMTASEKDSVFTVPVKQRDITQEMRQKMFDNYATTDDHGMHIVGKAFDQNQTKYYLVKNSWGTGHSEFDGYFFVSEAYLLLKTIIFAVHKEGVPEHIMQKIN